MKRRITDQVLAKGSLAERLAELAVQASSETDERTGLLIERLAQAALFTSDDKHEGTRAFVEKRKPDFQGR